MPHRSPLRTCSLREIDAPWVTYPELIDGRRVAHAEVFPPVVVSPTRKVRVEGPRECGPQLRTLRECFADQSYPATGVNLSRLDDMFIGMPNGVCVSADGILLEETSRVARQVDPFLASIPFISLSDNAFSPDTYTVVDSPVLHCFHRASGAYGHFLFDTLPVIALCHEAIRDGRVKLLMPGFPEWGLSALGAFGIESRHILQSQGQEALRCNEMLISDTLTTLNTFLPNPAFCRMPAGALGIDIATPWTDRDTGSRVYLSRENQPNYFARSIENEEALRMVLRSLGFTVLEPANMPFPEQVIAINNASLIVGPHGSGFGNLIFARPGTAVIDLMPQDWVGYWGDTGGPERWLLNVTTALDLEYTVILCKSRVFQHLPDTDTSGLQQRGIAATVDLDLLQQLIV
jgi:capsular polysaccharide biosynthesis protein